MWFKYGLKVHKRVCHKSTVRQRLSKEFANSEKQFANDTKEFANEKKETAQEVKHRKGDNCANSSCLSTDNLP